MTRLRRLDGRCSREWQELSRDADERQVLLRLEVGEKTRQEDYEDRRTMIGAKKVCTPKGFHPSAQGKRSATLGSGIFIPKP